MYRPFGPLSTTEAAASAELESPFIALTLRKFGVSLPSGITA